jgi:hypothetical protein
VSSKAATPVSAERRSSAKGAKKASSSNARVKRFWSRDEELDLVRGVRKYGAGNWAAISMDDGFNFDNRTPVDLKDKWRNLAKKLPELEREVDGAKQPKKKQVKRARAHNNDDDDDDGDEEVEERVEDIESSDDEQVGKKAVQKKALSPRQVREEALLKRQKRLDNLE